MMIVTLKFTDFYQTHCKNSKFQWNIIEMIMQKGE